jgi:hypothetical protein
MEPIPDDAFGTWSRSKLMRMDLHFTRRVEHAFRRGTESRAAAGATVSIDDKRAAR